MIRPGRNEACWCGSGKKYKRCHLREDQAADRAGLEQGLSEEAEVEFVRRRVLDLRSMMLPGGCLEGLRFDLDRFTEVLSDHVDEVMEPVGGNVFAVDPRTGRHAWEELADLGHERLVSGGFVQRARAELRRAESSRGLSRAQRDAIRMGLSALWMDERPGEGSSPVVSALFPVQFVKYVQAFDRVQEVVSELVAWSEGLPTIDTQTYGDAMRRVVALDLDRTDELVAHALVGDAQNLLGDPDHALLPVDVQLAVRTLSKRLLQDPEISTRADGARARLYTGFEDELGSEVLDLLRRACFQALGSATADDLRHGWALLFIAFCVEPWSLVVRASLEEHVTYRSGEEAFLEELTERVDGLAAYLEGYEVWLREQGEEFAVRNIAVARRSLG